MKKTIILTAIVFCILVSAKAQDENLSGWYFDGIKQPSVSCYAFKR